MENEMSSDGVVVLGKYEDSGAASLVARRFDGSVRVFSGAPSLPAALWRSIAAGAGVHLYADCAAFQRDCDIGAARNGLLVHASGRAGIRTIRLPKPLVVQDEAGRLVCASPCAHFEVHLQPGEGRAFLVGMRRA